MYYIIFIILSLCSNNILYIDFEISINAYSIFNSLRYPNSGIISSIFTLARFLLFN